MKRTKEVPVPGKGHSGGTSPKPGRQNMNRDVLKASQEMQKL